MHVVLNTASCFMCVWPFCHSTPIHAHLPYLRVPHFHRTPCSSHHWVTPMEVLSSIKFKLFWYANSKLYFIIIVTENTDCSHTNCNNKLISVKSHWPRCFRRCQIGSEHDTWHMVYAMKILRKTDMDHGPNSARTKAERDIWRLTITPGWSRCMYTLLLEQHYPPPHYGDRWRGWCKHTHLLSFAVCSMYI